MPLSGVGGDGVRHQHHNHTHTHFMTRAAGQIKTTKFHWRESCFCSNGRRENRRVSSRSFEFLRSITAAVRRNGPLTHSSVLFLFGFFIITRFALCLLLCSSRSGGGGGSAVKNTHTHASARVLSFSEEMEKKRKKKSPNEWEKLVSIGRCVAFCEVNTGVRT